MFEFIKFGVPRPDSRPSVVLAWLTKPVTGVPAEVLNPALAAALLFPLAVTGLPVSMPPPVALAGAMTGALPRPEFSTPARPGGNPPVLASAEPIRPELNAAVPRPPVA